LWNGLADSAIVYQWKLSQILRGRIGLLISSI